MERGERGEGGQVSRSPLPSISIPFPFPFSFHFLHGVGYFLRSSFATLCISFPCSPPNGNVVPFIFLVAFHSFPPLLFITSFCFLYNSFHSPPLSLFHTHIHINKHTHTSSLHLKVVSTLITPPLPSLPPSITLPSYLPPSLLPKCFCYCLFCGRS